MEKNKTGEIVETPSNNISEFKISKTEMFVNIFLFSLVGCGLMGLVIVTFFQFVDIYG